MTTTKRRDTIGTNERETNQKPGKGGRSMRKRLVNFMNDMITSVIFGTIMYVLGEVLMNKFKDHKPTKGKL